MAFISNMAIAIKINSLIKRDITEFSKKKTNLIFQDGGPTA